MEYSRKQNCFVYPSAILDHNGSTSDSLSGDLFPGKIKMLSALLIFLRSFLFILTSPSNITIEYGYIKAGTLLVTSSINVEHGNVTSTKSNTKALLFKIAFTNKIFSLSSVYAVILFFLRLFPSATTFKSN